MFKARPFKLYYFGPLLVSQDSHFKVSLLTSFMKLLLIKAEKNVKRKTF
jgi:hypothetical protein